VSSGPLRLVPLSEHRKILETNRNAVVEKRLSRKLEPNRGWTDQTEVHINFKMMSNSLQEEYFGLYTDGYRCFRNLAITDEAMDIETDADSIFSAADSVSSMSSAGSTASSRTVSRYRQRYGRGGRIWVDRTLTASEKENLEKTQLSFYLKDPILEERWKYDPRASEDEKPIILDEDDIQYVLLLKYHFLTCSRQIVYRARLLPPSPDRRMPGGVGLTVKVIPSVSSPQLMRSHINSPSMPRPSLPLQTPK